MSNRYEVIDLFNSVPRDIIKAYLEDKNGKRFNENLIFSIIPNGYDLKSLKNYTFDLGIKRIDEEFQFYAYKIDEKIVTCRTRQKEKDILEGIIETSGIILNECLYKKCNEKLIIRELITQFPEPRFLRGWVVPINVKYNRSKII